ncbi:phenylalanine--tRNA ligase subunit beta [uncultured Campylobacter sp.]|uniref:phenylalanine--tRNA ligase subunit beta n=1 Tax=uncultured Campylobacter sp. TaxID=218934 RepID=UPI00260C2424|nr:phenylalanine--tRNA ligase subunit beta [uncultured Campylobacter sp.]
MIITRNWLQEWVDIREISSQKLQETLNSIGLEVGGYREIAIPSKVVIGFVKSKAKHENSDHLSVCEVDVADETLQIVCGAKNVAVGQYVAVALIGAVLPGDFKIKKSKLRGVESFGMICSSTELGLPKINDGIMVLDSSIGELTLGEELCKNPWLNDEIFEIDLTPNRGDCLSVYGIARDLCAALDISLKEVNYDEKENLLGIGRIISINSSKLQDCSFQYRAFDVNSNVSKLDLLKQLRLAAAGIYSAKKIDDILSYATYSTGVLLRAYDLNKICTDCDKITFTIKQEKCGAYGVYANDKLLSIAGISQVDEFRADNESKTIIIEANYTAPTAIQEAVGQNKELKGDEHLYRSTRGSEPNLTIGGDFLFSFLAKMSGINLYGGFQQICPHKERFIVSFSIDEISSMIGKELDKNSVVKILKRLCFDVNVSQELINVGVPFFRHDIKNSHDICEEIVRIIGIENIESRPLLFSEKNRLNKSYELYTNQKNIRYKAANNGFIECIHYAFDSKEELSKLGFKPCQKEILNPINNELDTLRPTLINHLLKSSLRNIKNSKKSIKLFEIGTIFDEIARESVALGFVASGYVEESSLLNGPKPKMVDFIYFANLIQNIIGDFRIELPKEKLPFLSQYEQANIVQDGEVVGYIGRVSLALENELELYKSYLCQVDFAKLKFQKIVAKKYSKMPTITRDISLIVPKELRYEKIKEIIDGLDILNLKEFYPTDIYSDESLKDKFSLTIKLTFQDDEKTLKDEDVTIFVDKIISSLNDKLGLNLR